jgi:hypothetical protein
MSSKMFRTVLFFLLTLAFLLFASCSPSPTTTPLGREVSLAPGQSVSIDSESLEIKFVEVINDSRCASGVTCIWQGEVSGRLDITYRDVTYSKVVTQPGLTSDPSSSEFNGYVLRFNVQPYPTAGTPIKENDYRLQLTVDKKSS